MPIPTPVLFLLFVIPTANLMILAFLGLYLRQLNKDKKALEDKSNQIAKKEVEVDSDFHKAVSDNIGQERKIIEDATQQAKSILTETQYVSTTTKEIIDKALQKMIEDVRQDATHSSDDIALKHKTSLSQISNESLGNMQKITKQFEEELQKQMQDFRTSLLPNMEKEIEEYKNKRLKDAETKVNEIIQKVSQEVLNKSLSLDDHKNLIIESLEKSRKEGLFD